MVETAIALIKLIAWKARPESLDPALDSESLDPGPVAVGTWSGGRFMRFGEPIDDERFVALIAPDESIRTVITADVYGAGDADRMLGRALAGRPREEICVVGAVGHDFYEGERDGPKGFPRFTDPRLRSPAATPPTCGWRPSAASSAAGSTASTCCCCTTPIAPATRARPCGTGWRRCATPG